MKLIAYGRISDPGKQGDNYSLPGQEARMRGWAQLYGHELVDVVLEGESAKSVHGRSKFKAVLNRILKQDEADGILVPCLDRFSRNEADAHLLKRAFDQRGKYIICTDEPINTSEPHGDIIFGLLVSLAAAEYKKIVGRFKTGTERARAAGRDLRAVPPYGMRAEGEGKERKLVEDKNEQMVIRDILVYAGRGMTDGEIATALNDCHPKPRKGGKWQTCTVRTIRLRAEKERMCKQLLKDL